MDALIATLSQLAWIPEGMTVGSFATLAIASVFTSALTAAFGIGGGIAMIAILLTVLPPAVVVPLHGVIQGGSNLGRVLTMRRWVNFGILRWFSLGAVCGITLGSLVVVALPTRALQIILGVFILWTLWGPGMGKRAIADRSYALVGLVASFCTMFIGATGPLVGSFWRVETLGRQGVVANHAACMTVQHGLKVGAFAMLGFPFLQWLPFLAAMIAAGFIGTLLGTRLLKHLPDRGFALAFRAVLTVLAARLIWTALFDD